jgi:hypothetical protein
MVTVIYTILLLTCPLALFVFGFFVGRCARKIPILDDNLPWALHRGQIPREDYQTIGESKPAPTRDTLRRPSRQAYPPNTATLRKLLAPPQEKTVQ